MRGVAFTRMQFFQGCIKVGMMTLKSENCKFPDLICNGLFLKVKVFSTIDNCLTTENCSFII